MAKKKNEITVRSSAAEYLTFIAATGDSPESIEMRYEDENIWLTQRMMAELYNVDVNRIRLRCKKRDSKTASIKVDLDGVKDS